MLDDHKETFDELLIIGDEVKVYDHSREYIGLIIDIEPCDDLCISQHVKSIYIVRDDDGKTTRRLRDELEFIY